MTVLGGDGVSLRNAHAWHLGVLCLADVELCLLIFIKLVVTCTVIAVLYISWSSVWALKLWVIGCIVKSICDVEAVLKPFLVVLVGWIFRWHENRSWVSIIDLILILRDNLGSASILHIIPPPIRHICRFRLILRIQQLHWCNCFIAWVWASGVFDISKIRVLLLVMFWHTIYFIFVVYRTQWVELGGWWSSTPCEWSRSLDWVLNDFTRLIDHKVLNFLSITCCYVRLIFNILNYRIIFKSLILPMEMIIWSILSYIWSFLDITQSNFL